MAISRTPKRQAEEHKDDSIFVDPIAQVFEDVDHEFDGKGKEGDYGSDARIEALAKQLTDMQNRLSEAERTNMALLTMPQGNRSQVTDQPMFVDPMTVKLPDPALDPDGFDAATARRNELRDQNRTSKAEFESRRKREQDDKVEDLWANFSSKFEDYAGDREKIDFVSIKLAKAAQRRGIDVERYMFVTQDKFMQDIVSEYNKVFGEPVVDDNRDEDREDTRRSASRRDARSTPRRRNREEDVYEDRTRGVFGGNEGGGRARSGKDAETGPTMIDDLYAIQKGSGFY